MRARLVLLPAIVFTFASASPVRAASDQAPADHPAPVANRSVFARSAQYPLLPRALEVELALSAAPKHLREAATVWALEQSGYTKVKEGTNAFSCLVSRRAGDLFPVCWDAEGARSLLPIEFDDAQLRLSGKSTAEIDTLVDERFKQGQYHPPTRAGIDSRT